MSKSCLFLLDGMALAYRAHFAFINSNLQNSEGIPTGPILGFANTLEKMLEKEEPTHIAVAWDTHAPTFRHEMDEAYKANRPPQPEELKIGIPLIKEMLEGYQIENIEKDGYEADDLIGTIASQANAEEVEVFMVTPDKDFMQLVHDHVKMYKPDNRNGGFNIIGREGVMDYFGVYPEKVVDVLAILGDKSDNVPGVKGIGKKGAPKLINKYGNLEAAIEDAPNMSSKRHRKGLTNYADEALHAKEMVKIVTDIPDVIEWQALEWTGADARQLAQFFKKMEFRTLTKKYITAGVAVPKGGQGDLFTEGDDGQAEQDGFQRYDEEKTDYTFVDTEAKLADMVAALADADEICFDTETTDVDWATASLVGLSISPAPQQAWYVPFNLDELPTSQILEQLQPLFKNEQSLKIAHNYKFDLMIMQEAGFTINGPVFDTMLAGYLIDSDQSFKLDLMAQKYLNYVPIPIADLIGEGKKQRSMDQLDPSEVSVYACEDADITYRLYRVLKPLLENDELTDLATEVEFPLIKVLAKMEHNGILVDDEKLEEFSALLAEDMRGSKKGIYEIAGHEFNLNSPKQLREVLFEELDLPPGKKTKTGKYSTAESELKRLSSNDHDIASLILDYRKLNKLKSTYVDALPKLINEKTGRIHTDFNQQVASTGRLSSSNPNLQNIPIRTKRGREIRKAFVAEEGFQLLSADYSQVELRVIAAIAEDENMMQAFENDEDIHSRTAMEIFDLASIDEVTPDQRRKAKEVNFGIPYGVSAYGLANRLNISRKEGKQMIDQYFERFPKIQEYINQTKQFAKEHGYVQTLMGRRRYLPRINSSNWNTRSFAERMAINMPIQGAAADIIKKAMINIYHFLNEDGVKSRMLLQVHDELIFEIADDEADDLPQQLKDMMEHAVDLSVPLKVEMGLANNWLDAH